MDKLQNPWDTLNEHQRNNTTVVTKRERLTADFMMISWEFYKKEAEKITSEEQRAAFFDKVMTQAMNLADMLEKKAGKRS